MDDGTGSAKKAAVILTGFLVFVGAGCGKTPAPTPAPVQPVAQQVTETEDLALESLDTCEESSVEDSWDEMRTRFLESYDIDQLLADHVDDEMKKHEVDGWRFRQICLKKEGSEVRFMGIERYCLRKEGPEQTVTSKWCVLDKPLNVPSNSLVVEPGSWHRIIYARFNTDQPGAVFTHSRPIETSGEREEDGIIVAWPSTFTFARDPELLLKTGTEKPEYKKANLTFDSATGNVTLLPE
jgi:hypothetical protein